MTTREPTDPDAGRAMPTDPNDVALDADCMVPDYWPTTEPTDTPTPPHLVDAAAPAMREVFRRVAAGQIGVDDAVDILLDWPNRFRRECTALCADLEEDRDTLEAENRTLRAQLDSSALGESYLGAERDWLREQAGEMLTVINRVRREWAENRRHPTAEWEPVGESLSAALDALGLAPEPSAPPAEGQAW